jgi:hypothetical protein
MVTQWRLVAGEKPTKSEVMTANGDNRRQLYVLTAKSGIFRQLSLSGVFCGNHQKLFRIHVLGIWNRGLVD